jgi:RNA polymerase sigma factor for flagellar operon FliA
MLDREAAEALFLDHLGLIDKIASMACNGQGMRGADAEDFIAHVRMKLVADDYAVVRRFAGSSEFKTYLTTVVSRLAVNIIREQRGRWRPSAAAARLGAEAAELERLVRGGYTLQQAGEKMRTAGHTARSDADLARLLGELPERAPLRPVLAELDTEMDAAISESRADERVAEAEADSRRAEILRVLEGAMGQLEPAERVIMKLRFIEGHTLADVARTLSLEQKPLYRRVERLRARLLGLLESAGLSRDDVRGLFHENDTS